MFKHLKARRLAVVLAVSAVLALAAFWLAAGRFADIGGASRFIPPESLPRLKAVKMAAAFIAMVEKPDAVRVLLAGSEADQYRFAFEIAGLEIAVAGGDGDRGEVRYDIVFTAGKCSIPLASLAKRVSSRGVFARMFDVHAMTFANFKKELDAFPAPDWRLWMPGARDWIVTGRPVPRKDKMSAMLDFFAQPRLVTPETEEAGCSSMPELFASYVGAKRDIEKAFAVNGAGERVRPECFILDEVPDIDWISPEGMDGDIVATLAASIQAVQANRRSVVKAAMLSLSPEKENEAVSMWAAAMKFNPRDTMLLDRLYLLAVNAKAFSDVGNIAYAARCYETMIAIRPDDARVLERYAACLDRLGKKGLAEAVREKARTLR